MARGTGTETESILYGQTGPRSQATSPDPLQEHLRVRAGTLELGLNTDFVIKALHLATKDCGFGQHWASQRMIMLRDKSNLPRPAFEDVLDELVDDELITSPSVRTMHSNSRRWELTDLGRAYAEKHFEH